MEAEADISYPAELTPPQAPHTAGLQAGAH